MSNQQIIDSYYQDREEPAPDLMELLIDDLEGNEVGFDLSEVGPVYPDDDVIYISGVPCRLSSARPNHGLHATGQPSHTNENNTGA